MEGLEQRKYNLNSVTEGSLSLLEEVRVTTEEVRGEMVPAYTRVGAEDNVRTGHVLDIWKVASMWVVTGLDDDIGQKVNLR